MYTIYYIFLIVIIVFFVTGIILNIIENKNKSINTNSIDNTKIVSDKTTHMDFLNNLKSKSKFDFGIELNENDKIITLSTCTDDNNGRKVVHTKLIN